MKKKRLVLSALLLLGTVVASAQTTVNGTVTDKKGNPIPGAKVEIPGTEESVLTDLDGTFSLTTSSMPEMVNVYYVGMQPKSQAVTPDMLVRLAKTTWWNKKPDTWQWFAALQGAFPESGGSPAFGMSVGCMKSYGFYAKAIFSGIPSTSHEWDDFTTLKPWTKGNRKSGTLAFAVGGMIRLGCPFYFNLGLGYMKRTVAWELSDGSWAKYNDNSYSGLCIDAGLTLRCGDHFLVNGGILTGTKIAHAPYIGIGYSF